MHIRERLAGLLVNHPDLNAGASYSHATMCGHSGSDFPRRGRTSPPSGRARRRLAIRPDRRRRVRPWPYLHLLDEPAAEAVPPELDEVELLPGRLVLDHHGLRQFAQLVGHVEVAEARRDGG